MKVHKFFAISVVLVTLGFLIAFAAFPMLPEKIASHWNAEGVADGFAGKWVLFICPIITLIVLVGLEFIPRFDPLRNNYKEFHEAYEVFKLGFAAFFLYLQIAMIAFNYYSFNFSQVILPGFAVFFYLIGVLLKKAKRNWFVGIRTPWTLQSDVVWDKTHKLGAKLFKAIAVIVMLLLFVPGKAFLVFIAALLIAVAYLYWYSYQEYHGQITRKNRKINEANQKRVKAEKSRKRK